MKTIEKVSVLDLPLRDVECLLRRPATLRTVAASYFVYDAVLPAVWIVGQTVNIRPRFWFWPWASDHVVTVISMAEMPTCFVMTTKEAGGPFKSWNHTMTAVALGDSQTEYTDTVTIDAGCLTTPFGWFVKAFYRSRHRQWKRLAKQVVSV